MLLPIGDQIIRCYERAELRIVKLSAPGIIQAITIAAGDQDGAILEQGRCVMLSRHGH